MARETTQVSGTVEGVNEKGLKVSGQWFNYSKHHTVPAVTRGQAVTLTIEGGKWINGLTLNGASSAPTTSAPAAPQAPSHTPTPGPKRSETFSPDADDEPNHRTQIRLAAVQASTTFHATRECSFDDVLNFAGQIEEWVGRA